MKRNYLTVALIKPMEIITLKSLSELEKSYNDAINVNKSEIYESDISFSFRIFENKQSTHFFQTLKHE